MRTRILLSAVTFSVVGTSGVIAACSSDDANVPLNAVDSGSDVTVVDSSHPDVADAAPQVDAAQPDAADVNVADTYVPWINGCNAITFEASDYTALDASRVITFPDANPYAADGAPLNYSPQCMTIKVGESVAWTGNFAVHPLAPDDNKPNNPIPNGIDDGGADSTVWVNFPEAGWFGYECTVHALMRGAINVQP